jgi:hypothetical protein
MLQVGGPILEHYLVGRQDTADESSWRTEVDTATQGPACTGFAPTRILVAY